MKPDRWLWALAVVAVAGCPGGGSVEPEAVELEALVPDVVGSEDWVVVEGPTSYASGDLWQYLDGGAPRYQAYGFRRMVHVRYQLGDDALASVTADVYDMGSELGAFGIYRSIRPLEAHSRPWCAEGHRLDTIAAAWRGSIFLHVSADDGRPELTDVMEEIVSRICAQLTGTTDLPAILAPLPADRLVPYSERYVANDLLGHADFGGGVQATFEIDGRAVEVFYADLATEAEAAQAVASYGREKERWATVEDVPRGIRFVGTGSVRGVVVTSGRFVVGVEGNLPFEKQHELLEELMSRLES